jgi:hypothetical protein
LLRRGGADAEIGEVAVAATGPAPAGPPPAFPAEQLRAIRRALVEALAEDI